jgi:hypothetical protein
LRRLLTTKIYCGRPTQHRSSGQLTCPRLDKRFSSKRQSYTQHVATGIPCVGESVLLAIQSPVATIVHSTTFKSPSSKDASVRVLPDCNACDSFLTEHYAANERKDSLCSVPKPMTATSNIITDYDGIFQPAIYNQNVNTKFCRIAYVQDLSVSPTKHNITANSFLC